MANYDYDSDLYRLFLLFLSVFRARVLQTRRVLLVRWLRCWTAHARICCVCAVVVVAFFCVFSECAACSFVLPWFVPGTRGYNILGYSLYRAPFVDQSVATLSINTLWFSSACVCCFEVKVVRFIRKFLVLPTLILEENLARIVLRGVTVSLLK